jgi:eukaryotic-like serine/threonine-protein kinase
MGSPPLSGRILRFGRFELDPESQQLRKAGALLRIQPQPLKVLCVLVSRAGQVVSREELRQELWGNETYVDFEQGLNYCIRQIRAVLGDEAQTPQYVETIPRRGYRFLAPVDGPVQEAAQRRGLRSIALTAVLGVSIITLIVIAALDHQRRPILGAKDSILVTEFVNNTGDPIFDGTLRKAVTVDLGQSPYLNIVSDENIKQLLGLMSRTPDTHVTSEIGREMCRRNGIKAMLTGSISTIGNQYLVTVEAVDPISTSILAQEEGQAAGKEQVLSALGKCADRLRGKLGEAIATLKQFDKPLEQVTTSSLEALQLFTLGVEKRATGELAMLPYLNRAVQVDPNFALAYAYMGSAYSNLEEWNLAEEYYKKALVLSDRVSERERLYVTAHYYQALGQREKTIETYELYGHVYPNDGLPQNNLAMNYNELGQFDKALDHALLGLSLNPHEVSLWSRTNGAHAYAALGRLQDARAIVTDGLKIAPDTSWLLLDLSNIALAQGDDQNREQADAALKRDSFGALNLLYRDAALAASQGRLREADEMYLQAKRMALQLGLKDNAAYAVALQAMQEAYLEHPALARTNAKAALKSSQMFDAVTTAAWALASAGDDSEAAKVIGDLAKQRPEDTLLHFAWVPGIEAFGRLNHGDAEQAIQILVPVVQYDRGNPAQMLLRATAYLKANRATNAIDEFQRVLALKSLFPYDPACSLAQLGVARAYVLAGDRSKGRVAYGNFIAVWKDADPDIPILRQAKAEYAKLQ